MKPKYMSLLLISLVLVGATWAAMRRLTLLPRGASELQGTSSVAGGLALLISAWPGASVTLHEQALLHAAVDLGDPGPDDDHGAGRLDVMGAYDWLQGLPRYYLPAIRR